VNYRLSRPASDPNRAVHPAHAEDVGAAVGWIEATIGEFGGDPDAIALLGHSAGGHLVSLVGMDPQFVEDAGAEIESVRCIVANDTEGYDLRERVALGGRSRQLVRTAFGDDPSVWKDASPIEHVEDRREPPDVLVITRGSPRRIRAARTFADTAVAAGAEVTVLRAWGYSHADVNRRLGTPDDAVVTPAITTFLDTCLPVPVRP
jgi:acetyl esterase/lipase